MLSICFIKFLYFCSRYEIEPIQLDFGGGDDFAPVEERNGSSPRVGKGKPALRVLDRKNRETKSAKCLTRLRQNGPECLTRLRRFGLVRPGAARSQEPGWNDLAHPGVRQVSIVPTGLGGMIRRLPPGLSPGAILAPPSGRARHVARGVLGSNATSRRAVAGFRSSAMARGHSR